MIKLLNDMNSLVDKNNLPRITHILSAMLHEDYLMNWANWLGFKRIKYLQELNRTADIGTAVHNAVESILRNEENNIDIGIRNKNEINNGIESFKLWYSNINNIEILSMEESLQSPWFRGTYDILARINGKIYLIDLKTSNNVSYKHFLQLSAYRFLILNNKNIRLDGCMILQLSKKEIKFTEYILLNDNISQNQFINECEYTFLSLVTSYHHRIFIENKYKNIFKKE